MARRTFITGEDIEDKSVRPEDLKTSNNPDDGWFLAYDAAYANFKWVSSISKIESSDGNTKVDTQEQPGTIVFKVNGTEKARVNNDGLIASRVRAATDGSASAPAFAFASDPGAGFYRIIANRVAFCPGSGKIAREDEIVSNSPGDGVRRNRYYGTGNSNSTPHIAHNNDLDTGILFLPSQQALRIVASAKTRLHASNNGVYMCGSEVPDSELEVQGINMYIDEENNSLVFKVKYSNGSIKTASLALK